VNLDIKSLKRDLISTTVQKPVSGTLSGHAAGEPFDKHVFKFIKEKYPQETFRQYEYLNKLYSQNKRARSVEDRFAFVRPMSLAFLLNRGKTTTREWAPSHQFEEKQNDTADILVVRGGFFNLVDVKTFNTARNGQPPNIISAYKLAQMCALMLDGKDFDSHDITYVGIAWTLVGKNLKCTDVAIKELFKTDPANLYINWAAAMQIQFHVSTLDQSYKGDTKRWCKDYLRHFVNQANNRAGKMIKKFVRPFERFLK